MAVVLADGNYQVRKRAHEYTRDAHGTPVPPVPGSSSSLLPGAATEQPDGSWTLRLDPALWPVYPDDLVDRPADSRSWLVETAVYRFNTADPAVDYVACTASLQPPRKV